jgi:uncharacterized protein involved in outer membrane biogenesis
VKKQGSAWIAENTERTLAIEKVYFNPFTLKVELSGVTLTEPAATQPFVAWDRLMVSVSLRSIIDQALILRRIELDHPYVKIDMLGQHEFNFSDFMHLGDDSVPVTPEATAEEEKPFLFSFNNIVITAGEIDFNDQASPQSSHHEIRQFDLSVPVIGNVAYLADEYVTPELSMLLNGSDINAQGHSKPFNTSLETDFFLELSNTDLSFYTQNSPVALPVDMVSGILDCEISLKYLVIADQLPQLLIGGDFAITDLVVNEPDGAALFSLPILLVDLEQADVFNQDITLSQIALYAPKLSLSRETNGQLNLQRLFPPTQVQPEKTPAATAAQDSTLPLLLISKLIIMDGQISFNDESLSSVVTERIHDLTLTVDDFSTHPDQQAMLDLHLQTDRQLDVAVKGRLGTVPPQLDMSFAANGLELEPYYPYLEQILTAPLAGQLDVAGQVTYAAGASQIHEGELTLRDLRVPFAGDDRFTLGELKLRGTAVDVNGQQIHLGKLTLTNGDILATRLADGSFSPEKLLRPAQPSAQPQPQVASGQQQSKPWSLDLASLDLAQFNLKFSDETSAKKPVLVVKQIGLHAEKLSYPEAQKSPFKLTAKVGKNGDVRVDGSVVHTPLQLQANSHIKEFPLADFNDFIPPDLQLKVKDGQLFSNVALLLNQQSAGLSGTFSGDVGIQRFNLLDTQGGELISWDGLNLTGIKGDVAPFALHIKQVALEDYQANIEIAADGKINLTSVRAGEEVAATGKEKVVPETEKVVVAAQVEPSAEPPADIRIDAVTLQGGTVSFIDRHLPSTFATTMYDLGGRISGLESDEQMQADVDLRGQLENNSPLTITGKINPLSNDLFADLTISFKDIDLSSMTPYSGQYLGYAIDKGKLYLDLNYNIEHQQITADNKVMVDQFTFGDSIESEDATSLPVALAISLLKDRNDEIHLDIPISGNLNDPNFSLAGTIFTVLRNLLIKAATSPFALLSSMVGGGADVSSVDFSLGRSDIGADKVTTLNGLADILLNRPSLTLEISGFADKNNDPEAYRRQQLLEMMQTVKWNDLNDAKRKTLTVQQLEITAEDYPELLKQVYKDAEFPRPRNMVGLLKSLPQEEMEKLLLANIVAGDEEMAALAKARAMAVRDGLLAINAELKPRLYLMKSDIYAVPESGPASRVEFGISAK